MKNQLSPAQLELLELVQLNDAHELSQEFMLIHDLALYHSDCTIDQEEKNALFQLKQVAEILKRMNEEKSLRSRSVVNNK